MTEQERQFLKERWDDAHEKQLERILTENKVLRELFKKHPERKDMYRLKILDNECMPLGQPQTTHKWCDTCMFCEEIDPIGRQPQTRYCKIYGRKNTHGKPDEVIYYGARCEFYEKQ